MAAHNDAVALRRKYGKDLIMGDDIGKNLVGLMLGSNADIIVMSGLLTTTITYFPTVIEALEKAELKSKVKVMIGGTPVSRAYADELGAEGFCRKLLTRLRSLIWLSSPRRIINN